MKVVSSSDLLDSPLKAYDIMSRSSEALSSMAEEVISLSTSENNGSFNAQTNGDVDAMLAADLNRMSVKERNNLIEELHGVEEEIEETPEFLAERLNRMEIELQRVANELYLRAVRLNPDYIKGRKFCLMFLRAASYDPAKAAVRMIKFLKEKYAYFGGDALARPLYLSDLDKEEMKVLKSGLHQVFSSRTMAGKVVVGTFLRHTQSFAKQPSLFVKTFFFIVCSLAEFDEETQRRGVVVLVWGLGPQPLGLSPEIPQRMGKMQDFAPIRTTGIHMCTDDYFIRTFKKLIVGAMNRDTRVRLRLHTGSATECQYSIMSFGIPVNSLPLATDQDLRTGNQQKWMAKQKAKDRVLKQGGTFDFVDIPGLHDVILGRGKVFQDHSGNQHMRSYVRDLLDDFQNGDKEGKRLATDQVIDTVHSKNGRFIKRNDDGWFETVSRKEAVEKVAASFRTMLSVRNKAQDRPTPRFVVPVEGKRSRIFIDGAEDETCCMNVTWNGGNSG